MRGIRQLQIRYDPVGKIAYIYLKDSPCWVDKVIEVAGDPRVTADLDETGKVIGFELAGVSAPVIRTLDWRNPQAVETVEPPAEYL